MPIKTLVPQAADRYSAFPTCTLYQDAFFIFYREGCKGKWGTHGYGGSVKSACWRQAELLTYLDGPTDTPPPPTTTTLFAETGLNEMDAIVSDLGNTFSLATRHFDRERAMFSFVSFSADLQFTERRLVQVPGVRWFVFYGKAFAHGDDYLFPAYGACDGVPYMQPLLLATPSSKPGKSWRLFQAVPNGREGLELNESSLCRHNDRWHIWSRKHQKPFALYHATSPDLHTWTKPVEWQSRAHAPMAAVFDQRVFLSYRSILNDSKENGCENTPVAGTTVSLPFEDTADHAVETFPGNPYDGGYSDLAWLDDRLLVVYYHGNQAGEPYIRAWLQAADGDWGRHGV